ncbi:TolC family outer membrane protein [Oceanicoccus sp. KOV_DT_Chl]|uniref:TolC family outer membrane protein n=1 Tax=Oceanicoccus sp. KOV_DT_Chl TaxID=1904639 RepID=UPI000C7A4A7E|nr:TolC family outer membrane protein [Oceanicoccus sp. KOV_DT_Chl]
MKSLLRPLSLAIALCAGSFSAQADTLADIYELALKNDAKLKGAEASYKSNLETEKQAFAAMLPQISGSASYTETDGDTDSLRVAQDPLTGSYSVFESNSESDIESEKYSLTLSQNIFDLPTWFTFKRGKEITKQAEAQFAFDQQDFIVRVAESYFDVLRALDNLEASKAEERATKRQLEQTQQRFDVGLIAITDVHEARAVYDSTVVQRLTDEGSLGTAYESLTVLTGQPHANLWLLNKDFPVINPEPTDRAEWVNFALQNNFALKAALYGMEAAHQNAAAKKWEHAPKITGSFTYSNEELDGNTDITSGSNLSTIPTMSDGDQEIIMFKLDVPIFTGGRVSSQRRQAYEQYNIALQTKIDTQRTVIRNTRAQHITVNTDVQRVKARQQAIVSTSSALDATQAGYEVGTRNIVDVLQAQRTLYNSIRDYANSRYDYVLSMLKLKRAAGTLSPQDLYDINKWMVSQDAPTANQYQKFLDR